MPVVLGRAPAFPPGVAFPSAPATHQSRCADSV